ncbi:MAG: tRNA lysidine(34) synthetase TilS [Lachnospiraceae bacterium]|nr:tRNA lysidine(34) synthetase TilS [Lachnospiraceae bacterium]
MKEKTEDIYVRVKQYIEENKMISEGDTIVTGVSGGADSVCLLVILWELKKEMDFKLAAVHVHHGVREDAGLDADYTRQLCGKLEIPFFLKKVDMKGYAKENGLSPEEAGRRLRYQAFEEIAEQTAAGCSYKIAVAHNNNDRAETLLFNLFRGSGLKGLGSIRPVREQVIRPLLCLDRAEIETYLSKKNIEFCIDSTNNEDAYARNRIRHHIIPLAEEQICRNITSHLGDTADILAETEAFVQKQTESAYKRCIIGTVENELALNLNIFRAEDSYLQKTLLLKCMEQLTPHRKDITKEHIEALLKLTGKDGCKEISLPYGLKAYKEYDRLIIRSKLDMPEYPPISIPIPGEVTVPELGVLTFKYLSREELFYKKGQIIPEKTYTKWFDCDKITTTLLLRTRQAGDYLTINAAMQKKTVKEYMVNEKIPKMQRERIYLLADGAHILWIPGYRISQYYKVDENTKRILQVQLRGGE